MLLSNHGRASLAALGLLVGGTALGVLPVGKFFAPEPKPVPPTPPVPPPALLTATASPSRAHARVGPVAFDATLGQSKLQRNADGTVFVDLRVTADDVKDAKAESRPVDLMLVLDVSGSMADDNKITLMRQACAGLVDQLSPRDRIGVVAFSDEASVLFPFQSLARTFDPGCDRADPVRDATARQAYLQAISQLVPTGSTNLSSGLELGETLLRSARPGAARRLLLLTDGIANRGESSPEGLRRIVSRLAGEGFSVSTVGLGLDYNASLLSMLGDVGGGNYYYVDAAAKIAAVYAKELRGLRALVAKGVRLTFEPAAGCSIDEVIGWASDASGKGGATVTIGDLEAARSTKVVVRMRVPTDRPVTAEEVLSVALKGEDARSGELLAPSPLALGIGITESRDEANASIATDIQKDLVNARIAAELECARRAAEQGRYDDAKKCVENLKKMNVDAVEFQGADGRVEKTKLEDIGRAFAPQASCEAKNKADKCLVSGAAAASK